MKQCEDLIAILEKSRAKMLAQLIGSDDQVNIYPSWTVREVLAHLSGWDDVAVIYLQALMMGQAPTLSTVSSIDRYNAESVAKRAGMNYDQVFHEYIQTRQLFIDLLRDLPEQEIIAEHILPWGEPGSLVDIVNVLGPHEAEHADDIEKKRAARVVDYNREAWNKEVESGKNPWTVPVSPDVIARARCGDFSVLLTENIAVPAGWIPPLQGLNVLALACGGGQQAPIFAAAGANVTVFDNSPRQLDRDREVAEREGLMNLHTVEGDARNLGMFASESFDFIFHPVSNLFIPNIRPVWQEAFRVLRRGGTLLTGFMNPIFYIFDLDKADNGQLEVKYKLPYNDFDCPEMRERQMENGWPLEYSHSLTDQLAGQMEAGFHLVGLYEDRHSGLAISEYTPTYLATRALKP